jgi:type VI protein secretion system component VasK
MKSLISLAVALRHELRERDDVQLMHLLELAALVLAVPVISVMVAAGGGHPADPIYWLLAGAFTLLVTLFVAGVVIQHVRASRANQ